MNREEAMDKSGLLQVDVAIIGAGTAGAVAMREVKRAERSFVLIDHGPLGTSCARVGCMPSKAVLHAGGQWQARRGNAMASDDEQGVQPLWSHALATRDVLVKGAASRTLAAAGDNLLMGTARFTGPDTVQVGETCVQAKAFIIATGSSPIMPSFLDPVRDLVLTTDELFYLDRPPQSIGIVGTGAIGLEMGLALARLGARVVACDAGTVPGGVTDPEVCARALQTFGMTPGLSLWLGRPVSVSRKGDHAVISNGLESAEVERVLVAVGRRAELSALNLQATGIEFGEDGLPKVDPGTLRAGASTLFFAGDATADRALQHEAADEGAIAAWNAAHLDHPRRFRRRVPLRIVFSNPDLAVIGQSYEQLARSEVMIGTASGLSNGRSRVMGVENNLLRVYAAKGDGRLIGASLVAVGGEHLAHLLAWAIQRGETAASLLEMPFYHPTVEEMLQSALGEIVKQQQLDMDGPLGLRPCDEDKIC